MPIKEEKPVATVIRVAMLVPNEHEIVKSDLVKNARIVMHNKLITSVERA